MWINLRLWILWTLILPTATDSIPLIVLAIGGHGLSQPSETGYRGERERSNQLKQMLRAQAVQGVRLLVVHGNGPQVGRLLQDDHDVADLDIHTAQTQGELGYLISQAMPTPNVALMTRVIVASEPGLPIKPIGPILPVRPAHKDCVQVADGWRLLVPSPKPHEVIELDAIRALLRSHHVVAGGGGGVPLSVSGEPVNAVIDKDWVAAQLAVALQADLLVFATDVDYVYADFGTEQARALSELDSPACKALLASGSLDAGSMGPKIASALEFVEATAKRACICAVEDIVAALEGRAGTQIGPRP
jgi:carbamate kinase